MYQVIFATHNTHKLREVQALMPNDIRVIAPAEAGFTDELPETGDSFAKNAREKCYAAWTKIREDVFAEDSGLEVEALGNAPGVYTARYAGENASDQANMEKLLQELGANEMRNATFVTVICLIYNGKQFEFEGRLAGRIGMAAQGVGGFGYDPVFIPEGYDRSLAELGDEVKNKISHRAKAVGAMLDFLEKRKEGTSLKEQGQYS